MPAPAFLQSCDARSAPVHKARSYVFGTLVEITIHSGHGRHAAHLASTVLEDFDRLHRLLHAWQDSPLVTLNRAIAAGHLDIPVNPEIARLIRNATGFSTRSRGLFNPAIGKLIRLWNFHASEFVPVSPDRREVQRVLDANPQMSDLILDGCTLNCANRHVQLDFGGYAKGYALDRAIKFLRRQGVAGRKGAQPWHIGIQHPRKRGPIALLPLFDGEAISTSGDYERYFMLDGKRHSHLIDPRTGQPARGLQSATVLAAAGEHAGTLSDASSGPLFVQGTDDWRQLASHLGIISAMLIDERDQTHLTDEMRRRLEFV
jgi:FAD:protein FMN transferase